MATAASVDHIRSVAAFLMERRPSAPPGNLGVPISDDSSEDEASQIRGLEEDRGIYHHQEVVVEPQFESDEDIPIRQRPQSPRRQHESIDPDEDDDDDSINQRIKTPEMDEFDDDSMLDENSDRKGPVRFSGHLKVEDSAGQHFNSPPPNKDKMSYLKSLEHPIPDSDSHGDSDEIFTSRDDFEKMISGAPSTPGYPPGSPPAYSSYENGVDQNNHARVPKPHKPVPPLEQKVKPKSTLNELLLAKVTQPFQNMIRRASHVGDDSDSDEDDDDFNDEELQVLSYIEAYKPVDIELRPQLRPFVLDYVPSIGDIDAFIKIPRPDDVDDNAGLTHLDEPASQQSDKTIMSMQLRNVSKEVSQVEETPVKLLSRADKNSEQIDEWVANIKELHRSRPAQTVHYKDPMPDIESLMQEWPPEFEHYLKTVKLPTADLDVSLDQYVDLCLNLFDIPVAKSRIQSLHLLFSLFSEFNNSQHFRNLAQNNMRDMESQNMDPKQICAEFQASKDAEKLQKFLEGRAAENRNWLEEWWYEAYTTNRASLLTQNMGAINPRAKSQKGRQIHVAAQFLHHVMQYWLDVRREEIEIVKSRGVAWDMSQTYVLFNSTRAPKKPQDELLRYFKTETEGDCPSHVIVLCNGYIWKLDIFKKNALNSTSTLFFALKDIMIKSSIQKPSIVPLTSLDRDSWAELRSELENLSSINKSNFDAIDKSTFVLSLSPDLVLSENELMFYALFGASENAYCDKNLNVIVMKDGKICQQAEHANVDAISLFAPCDYAAKLLDDTWEPEETPFGPAELLEFDLTENVIDWIDKSEKRFQLLKKSHCLNVFNFTKFGSGTLKPMRFYADTVVQIALQLAYFSTHNRLAATYETASTRAFYHGRTETLRSLTPSLAKFIRAVKGGGTTENQKRLFMEAYNDHNALMDAARNGKGIDRHFLGLKQAQKHFSSKGNCIEIPPFEHCSFSESGGNGNFKLSTSLLGYDDEGSFGYVTAMCEDGYGAFYKICENRITFTLTCFENGEADLERFRENLYRALEMIYELISK
ncbi:unnamed protein product [Caenorhabditis auriculariae]|uniref:Choline/carnitine acyltransferase domain-containing protein n=1 Tax=Caenorhabditis auriculariae TaxID=2777116 RepID=A0A8S1HDF8_9PELO|nr:unnamed protein product [Caenorhabditis auriculariae]